VGTPDRNEWVEKPNDVRDYKDLVAWKVSFELCMAVYRCGRDFPHDENYGLRAEVRKTARSVCCNIAEGHERGSTREFIRFLNIAQGSRAELETQLCTARELGYMPEESAAQLLELADRVGRLVTSLRECLRSRV